MQRKEFSEIWGLTLHLMTCRVDSKMQGMTPSMTKILEVLTNSFFCYSSRVQDVRFKTRLKTDQCEDVYFRYAGYSPLVSIRRSRLVFHLRKRLVKLDFPRDLKMPARRLKFTKSTSTTACADRENDAQMNAHSTNRKSKL
jgi:hypothetical protein